MQWLDVHVDIYGRVSWRASVLAIRLGLDLMCGRSLQGIWKHRGRAVPPSLIADVFSSAIRAFNDAIANAVLELFPGGLGAVMEMPDEAIYAILNDHALGGENFKKGRLCIYDFPCAPGRSSTPTFCARTEPAATSTIP